MEDKELIQKVVVICHLVSVIMAAGLILRAIFKPSWDHFGEALMFLFLTWLITWYRERFDL